MRIPLRCSHLTILLLLGACGGETLDEQRAKNERSLGLAVPAADPIPSAPTRLQNGVPLRNLSGSVGSEKFFLLQVPAGAALLDFTTAGGSGDANLYVKFGSPPSTRDFDCRPYRIGSDERCDFSLPLAGDWHVMLVGSSAYSGVTLAGNFVVPQLLQNDVPVSGLAGARFEWQFWRMVAVPGGSTLNINIYAGVGDADLYVKRGSPPTTKTFDCRSFGAGNQETCTLFTPAGPSSDYHIGLFGFSSFSGVTLRGRY